MSATEWWVMRVVVSKDGIVEPHIAKEIERGNLQVINGEVCEPIEWYSDQLDAMDRAIREQLKTGLHYKVTMNADLADLGS